jgi:hypothetical protein
VIPLRVVRILVIAVCVVGIAGMIIGSLSDNNNGVVVTFGMMAAVASIVLMSFTLATRSAEALQATSPSLHAEAVTIVNDSSVPEVDASEALAAALEDHIAAIVASGASETEVRDLVRRAVRFGRATRS